MSADISHDELARELPSLEKLSNAARQKLAKKRRAKQLKKYQEVIRLQRQTSTANGGSSVFKKKGPPKIQVENGAVLNDMVARNDIIGGVLDAYTVCILLLACMSGVSIFSKQ